MFKNAFSGRSEREGDREKKDKRSKDDGASSSGRRKHRSENDGMSVVSRRSESDHKKKKHHRDSAEPSSSRSGRLTEDAVRGLDQDDEEDWEDDEDLDARSERKSKKSSRSVRDDREREQERIRDSGREKDEKRGKSTDKTSTKSKTKSRSGDDRGERALPPQGSMQQFPGMFTAEPDEIDARMSGALPMDSHIPNQFPGQMPGSFSRPAEELNPHGAAADYYGDQGQSVESQPGVRPVTPMMLHNPDTHLITPSLTANPTQDTGHGTANDFYDGKVSPVPFTVHQAEEPGAAPSKPGRKPSKTGVAAALTAAAVGGLGKLPYKPGRHNSAPGFTPSGTAYGAPPAVSGEYNSTSNTNHAGLYTAAGAATMAAAGYGMAHNGHPSTPTNQSYYARPGEYDEYHEHRGPVSRFTDGLLDLISSPDDVRKMEAWTEYIGVCKHCFDPRSSPWDGPRQHHYHPRKRDSFESLRRRGSSDRLRRKLSGERIGSSRIEKDSRYDGKRSKMSKAEMAGLGMLGAGAATAGAMMLKDGKDFDDTYSVQTGHRATSAVRRRSRSSSHERRRRSSYGVIGPDHAETKFVTVRGKDGRYERRRIDASRSRSRERRRHSTKDWTGAATGAALGAAALGVAASRSRTGKEKEKVFVRRRSHSRSRSRSSSPGMFSSRSRRSGRRSPTSAYSVRERRDSDGGLFGGFFAEPKRSRKGHSKKQSGGFFSFSNESGSSLDEGLAFGGRSSLGRKSSVASLKSKRKLGRRTSEERMTAAVAGIGATAAALAAAQRGQRLNRHGSRPELGAKRETREVVQGQHGASAHDEEWEDELPSDVDDASSGESALAFGDDDRRRKMSRQSMESVVSNGSGDGGAWSWFSGSKKEKKNKRPNTDRRAYASQGSESDRRAFHRQSGPTSNAQYSSGSRRQSSQTNAPMQYVDPRPLSETGNIPGSRHASMPGSFDAFEENVPTYRPGPAPVQAPQPTKPFSPSFTQQDPFATSTPRKTPRRSATSPTQHSSNFVQDAALIGGAALATAGIIASQSKKNKDGSVRFGLTEEQQRREAETRQRERERAAEEERRSAATKRLKEEAERSRREEDERIQEQNKRRLREARESEDRKAREARDREFAAVAAAAEEDRRRAAKRREAEAQAELDRTRERERAREAEERDRRDREERSRKEHAERDARDREERATKEEREERARRERTDRDMRERDQRDKSDRDTAYTRDRRREEEDRSFEEEEDRERRRRDQQRDREEQEEFDNRDRHGKKSRRKDKSTRDQPSDDRDRKVDNERNSSSAWQAPVAAGVAGALVGAVLNGARHKEARDHDSARRDDENEPFPVVETWSARTIEPSNEHAGAPITDDDLFDPDRFKRKRSQSELNRHAELARKAADKVISDREDHYNAPKQSQAEFFMPEELRNRKAGEKERNTDPMGGNEVQVWHAPEEEVREHFQHPSYAKDGYKTFAMHNVPRLNVIAPTPPPPTSPAQKPKNEREDDARAGAETRDMVDERESKASNERRSRAVSWGEDQTHVYQVQTPESMIDRDSYIGSKDIPASASTILDEIVVEEDEEDGTSKTTTYGEDDWKSSKKSKKSKKSKNRDSADEKRISNNEDDFGSRKEAMEDTNSRNRPSDIGKTSKNSRDDFYDSKSGRESEQDRKSKQFDDTRDASQRKDRDINAEDDDAQDVFVEPSAYSHRQPFYDSVSDLGFAVDSPGTEGAPPVRGWVEDEEVTDPTPKEEKESVIPFSTTQDHERSARKDEERSTIDDATTGARTIGINDKSQEDRESAWEPPLSKKDKKKRDKLAKRQSITDDTPASQDSDTLETKAEALDSKKSVEVVEPEFTKPLSKKDKKKRDKALKRSDTFDSEDTETPDVQQRDDPISSTAVKTAERPEEDLFLSKKDKKKRDKALRRSGIFDSDTPETPDLQERDDPLANAGVTVVEEPQEELFLSKKEKKKRDKALQRSSTFDSDSQDVPDAQEKETAAASSNIPQAAEEEMFLSKKERKKREKAAKRGISFDDDSGTSTPVSEREDPAPQAISRDEPVEKKQPKAGGAIKGKGLSDLVGDVMTAGGLAALLGAAKTSQDDDTKRDGNKEIENAEQNANAAAESEDASWNSAPSKKDKKKRKKKLGESIDDDPRDIRPSNFGVDVAVDDQREMPAEDSRSKRHSMPGGWDEEDRRQDATVSETEKSSQDNTEPGEVPESWDDDWTSTSKKSKKKKNRSSGVYNEPAVSSPLRTVTARDDDYIGNDEAANNAVINSKTSNGTNGYGDDRKTEKSTGNDRYVPDSDPRDVDRKYDAKTRSSPEQTRGEDYDSRNVDAYDARSYKNGDDDYSRKYDDDAENRSRHERRRSKHDDDDTRSTTSSRSKKDKDESTPTPKEKKNGIFGSIFGRKQTEEAPLTKTDTRESRSSKDDEDEDQDGHHRRHRRRRTGSEYGEDDDDSKSTVSSSSRRHRRHHDDEDRNHRDDEDPGERRHHRHRSGDHESRHDSRDQSFLESRVEDLPPLPDSRPASPVSAQHEERELGNSRLAEIATAGVASGAVLYAAHAALSDKDSSRSIEDHEELPPLPESPPASPFIGLPVRPASYSTAVPLRFKTPGLPSASHSRSGSLGSPVEISSATSTPTSATRPKTPRRAGDVQSGEFKPLYLAERHRKTPEPVDDDLPSLPSSKPSSRASSVRDGDESHGEEYHSAAEDVFSSPMSDRRLRVDTDIARGLNDREDLLDSQQSTPRAKNFDVDDQFPTTAKQEPQFYTWEDLMREQFRNSQREEEITQDNDRGLALQDNDSELENLPALPPSRPESPILKQNEHLHDTENAESLLASPDAPREHASHDSAAIAVTGAVAIGSAAILATHHAQDREDTTTSDDDKQNTSQTRVIPDDTVQGDVQESSRQIIEPDDSFITPALSRKESKKAAKKAKKNSKAFAAAVHDEGDVSSETAKSSTDVVSRDQEQPMIKDASDESHTMATSTAPAKDEDIWDVSVTKKSKKNKKNKKTKAVDDPFTEQERELELGESKIPVPVAELEDVNRRIESDAFMQNEPDVEAGHAMHHEDKDNNGKTSMLDQQDQAFLDTERQVEEGTSDHKSGIAVPEELELQTTAEKFLHDEAMLEEDNASNRDLSAAEAEGVQLRPENDHGADTPSDKQTDYAIIADKKPEAMEDNNTDGLAAERAPAPSQAIQDPEELDEWQSSQSRKQSKKNKKKNKKTVLTWDEETPAVDESSKIVTPSIEKELNPSEEVANMAVIATEAMAIPVTADQKTEDVSTTAEEPKAKLDEDPSFTLITKKGKKGKKAKKQQKLDLWSDATDSVDDTALSKNTLQEAMQEKLDNDDGSAYGDKTVPTPEAASEAVQQIKIDKAHQPSVSDEADEPSLSTMDNRGLISDNSKTTPDHLASIDDSHDVLMDKSSNLVQADNKLLATDEALESSAKDNDPFATSTGGAEHTPGETQLLQPVVSKLNAVTPDVVEEHSAQQSEDIEPRDRDQDEIATDMTLLETPADKDPFETSKAAAEHTPGEVQLLQPVISTIPAVTSDDAEGRGAQQSQEIESRDEDVDQIATNRTMIKTPTDKDPFEMTKGAAEHTPGEAQLTGTPQYQLSDEPRSKEPELLATEKATLQPEEDEFNAWPTKKSKKDKKKAKKAAVAKWTEPEAEEESSSKDNNIGQAAVGAAALAATAAAMASLREPEREEAQQDDIWGELPKKQTKKDKRKAKKAAALAVFEEEPVPTPEPTIEAETHDNRSSHHQAQEVQDEATLKQTTMDEYLDEKGNVTPQLHEEEAQNIPLPADDVDDWTESDDRTLQASDTSVKATEQATQYGDVRHEDRSREDIEFAATLAAGLAGTGFDPNLVANDPVFHRRSSPSERSAEADPEEAEFKPYVRRRRSREQTPPDTKETMKDEETQAVPEHNAADDDFSAAVTRGLEASGFDAAALHSTADTSKETSLSERDNDMEELSWNTKRQKKGKKNKRQDQTKAEEDAQHQSAHAESHVRDSWDDFAEDKQMAEAPPTEHLNAEEGERDIEIASAHRDAENIVAADEEVPAEWAITTKKGKKGKKGKKSAAAIATAASSGTSTPLAINTEDVFTESAPITKDGPTAEDSMTSDAANLMGGDREMDVDEMDKAYKAYKKNKRKAKKDKYAAASSTSTPTTPAQIGEPDLDTTQRPPTREQHEEDITRSTSEHERSAEQDTPHHEMEQKTNVSNVLAAGLATTGVAAIAGGAFTHSRKHDGDDEYRSSHDRDNTTPSNREMEQHTADWSFSALDDNNNQSNANKSISKPIGEGREYEQQPILHPAASKESLSSRRSLDPLHVDVKQEDEGIRLPKRGDRKSERNTPQSRTSSSETPLEPTSRNRGSHLFQSTPITTPESKMHFSSPDDHVRQTSMHSIAEDHESEYPHRTSHPAEDERYTRALHRDDDRAGKRSDLGTHSRESSRHVLSPPPGDDPRRMAMRRVWSDQRSASVLSNGSNGSNGIHRMPEELRSFSRASNSSQTPSLRRISMSGDLRAASRASNGRGASGSDVAVRDSPKTIPFEPPPTPPLYDEDIVEPSASRAADMVDVYQGYGDHHGSHISPTRPPSVRKRQSMHIIELESRLDQLTAENRALSDARHSHNESDELHRMLEDRDHELREKNSELNRIRAMLAPMRQEVDRLTEINDGLMEANRNLVDDSNGRVSSLEAEHAHAHGQWQESSRELENMREQHTHMASNVRDAVTAQVTAALAEKDNEIRRVREELEIASEKIRALQAQIQTSKSSDFLDQRDEDYFDGACQRLCQHVQQWILRFSKTSDNRMSRLSADLKDEKIEARLDNAILDGSDVDKLLADRVRRRDVFMSVVTTMIWEYIFTRYLFGMDREQRQKLKALEKTLAEVGPPRAVAQWRATTLTLLSKRPSFAEQCNQDTEAVAEEIFGVLCALLPAPSATRPQLLQSLQRVIKVAVDLSIEMRTQRAEFIMLPPLQPEYDTNGELVRKMHFNAQLMNERSGAYASNEQLDKEKAVVKIVLFPPVVKKGDSFGEGSEEIVVCPAQVLVHNDGGKGKKVVRVMSGAIDMDDPRMSRQSLISTAPNNSII